MGDIEIRKDVFAWFGSAVYYSNLVEVELVTLLILLSRGKNPKLQADKIDSIETRLSQKTLGGLCAELRKHSKLPPHFYDTLATILEKRNKLIHQFFYQNATKLLSPQGCQEMIDELVALSREFKEANKMAESVSAHLRKLLGWDEAAIQALVEIGMKRQSRE